MTIMYTEDKLNSLDNLDKNLQLVLEQLADLKRHRFGRSTERHETEAQISFMEVNGQIVFFNEAEAVAHEEAVQEEEPGEAGKRPHKRAGKREADLAGLAVIPIEHTKTEEELAETFGDNGWKRLPDEIYRRYRFTPAKVEVEEHHVAVYSGKSSDTIVRADAPGYLPRGSLVSPSLEAAVLNAKYVNAVPLYRQEKEFERYRLAISRQDMAYWTIQCAERYLAVLYDYLHEKLYSYHVL